MKPEEEVKLTKLEEVLGSELENKHWKRARQCLKRDEDIAFELLKDEEGVVVGLRRKPPGPVKLLMAYLRTIKPGKVVSWEDMSIAIKSVVNGKSHTWKTARRRLEKEENPIWFMVVDRVGLRRTHRPVIRRAVQVELRPRVNQTHMLTRPRRNQLNKLKENLGFARKVKCWALAHHQSTGQPIGGKPGAEARKEYMERRERGEEIQHAPRTSAKVLRSRWTQVKKEPETWIPHHIRGTEEEAEFLENLDLSWVDDMIGSVPTYAIDQVETAYKNAFDRIHKGAQGKSIGWPRFPRKGERATFTFQDQSFKVTKRAIKLGKIGMVPISRNRVTEKSKHPHPFDRLPLTWGLEPVKEPKPKKKKQKPKGEKQMVLTGRVPKNVVKRLVVENRANRWWCTIMCEYEDKAEPLPKTGRVVGIDFGHKITIYDGTDHLVIDPPLPLQKYLRWKRMWNKAMSRRWQKGKKKHEQSKRWHAAKRKVQELDYKIACIRKHWCEWVSHWLTLNFDVLCVEGFDVRRFVSEAIPYRKQRRKIMDIGWGMLRLAIQRKAIARGRQFVKLGKVAATDQTCSQCGSRSERRDGLYRCTNEDCGHVDLRPYNTAELLYKHATGQGPKDFPGETRETLTGEVRDTTRGSGVADFGQSRAFEAPRDVKRTRDADAGADPAETGPALPRGANPGAFSSARGAEASAVERPHATGAPSSDKQQQAPARQKRGKARKARKSPRKKARARARSAKPKDREEAAE